MNARAAVPRGRVARPVERYGAPRPWLRPLVIALTVVLAVAGLAWLLWAALYHSAPPVAGELRGFEAADDHVTVTIAVERDPELTVRCLLEAQATDHSVVGEREVTVHPGEPRRVVATFDVPTERPATAAVVTGCRPAG